MKMPKDLRGDGRRCISPRFMTQVPSTCRSQKLTISQARMVVREFEARRHTVHGPEGKTVWVVVEWCELNGHEYTVNVHQENGQVTGYTVRLTKKAA